MLAEQSRYPNEYESTNIFITSKNDFDFQGLLNHPESGRVWEFGNVMEMTHTLEDLFNTLDYPQATYQIRRMNNDPTQNSTLNGNGEGADHLKNGDIPMKNLDSKPTFVVKVQYRQNASWQGTIQWLEANKTKQFRSVLELMKLMDDAASDTQEHVGWEEDSEE